MKQVKCDLEKKMQDLGKKSREDRIENGEKDDFKCRTINEKLCPFMSTPEADRACTQQCKFYRAKKKGYECPFSELSCISFNLNKTLKHLSN